MRLCLASVGLVVHFSTCAQQAFPRADKDPTGVVLDEAGAPIVGARVELVFPGFPPNDWTPAIAHVLEACKLPSTLTNRDGEFVLPLQREQRRLGVLGEGNFVLRITKDGFQRWCEPLPLGLSGYMGTRAVLPRLCARDEIAVDVTRPEPGMILLLGRSMDELQELPEAFDVPPDGKVRVRFPLAPLPRIASSAQQWRGITVHAQVLCPGRSTKPAPIDPRGEVRIEPPERSEAAFFEVVRSDGKPVAGLKTLFRRWDFFEHWFELPGSRIPTEPMLALVATKADGCREARAPASLACLIPLDERASAVPAAARSPQTGGLRFVVTTAPSVPGGAVPICGASVRLSASCLGPEGPRGRPPCTDGDGVAVVDGLVPGMHKARIVDDRFGVQEVAATVHAGRTEVVKVQLADDRELRIATVDAKGQPLPFCFPWGSATRLHTDSLGRLRVSAAQVEQLGIRQRRIPETDADDPSQPTQVVSRHVAAPVLYVLERGAQFGLQETQRAPVGKNVDRIAFKDPLAIFVMPTDPQLQHVRLMDVRDKTPMLQWLGTDAPGFVAGAPLQVVERK